MQNSIDALNSLLEPISKESVCGSSVRYNSVYFEIRLAREEDDPTLPMRQWERPLKVADWGMIESKCIKVLQENSKDLQIACWLLEAWVRQESFTGLHRGLLLIDELLKTFWEDIHPKIERDSLTNEIIDFNARSAPLEWLNHSISFTLRVHTSLANFEELKLKQLTLNDWDRLTANEVAQNYELNKSFDQKYSNIKPISPEVDKVLTRVDLCNFAKLNLVRTIKINQKFLFESKYILKNITDFLQNKLKSECPSFSKLQTTLDKIEKTFNQILNENYFNEKNIQNVNTSILKNDKHFSNQFVENAMPELITSKLFAHEELTLKSALQIHDWGSRENSYLILESIANYLINIEPHSLTPYLIRKAVNWGRMPLLDLLVEIMDKDGDLNRFIQILGIKNFHKH